MDPASTETLLEYLSTGGLVGLLGLIIVAGYYQKWCWGWQLRDMRAERDYWRNIALRTQGVAGALVNKTFGPPPTDTEYGGPE